MAELRGGGEALQVVLWDLEPQLPLQRSEHWPIGAMVPTVTTTQKEPWIRYTMTFLAASLADAEDILGLYRDSERVTCEDGEFFYTHTPVQPIRVQPSRLNGVITRWLVTVEGV